MQPKLRLKGPSPADNRWKGNAKVTNRNTYQEEKKVGLFVKMDKTSFIASPNCFADLTISTQYILTNKLPMYHAMPSNLL